MAFHLKPNKVSKVNIGNQRGGTSKHYYDEPIEQRTPQDDNPIQPDLSLDNFPSTSENENSK